MKYIIIILCLVLSSCGQRPNYQDGEVITTIKKYKNHCNYTMGNNSFSDSCGKFNIGDRVTTCKKN